jgi:uncharacterized protein (TIGR02328 family)
MRLWHQALISKLPDRQLLGQHRECCALRGLGWGRKHATVDYAFTHSYNMLFKYHQKVMEEMTRRGYRIDPLWNDRKYRGRNCEPADEEFIMENDQIINDGIIYSEHDTSYLTECLENLKRKGIEIQP